MEIAREGYSARRSAEIVGITYRQLDYWARTDLVRPSLGDADGSGSRRSYSYLDLLELKAVKTLLDAGIRLEKVRKIFGYVRRSLDQDVTKVNLVISGETVLVRTEQGVIDLLRKGQGVLMNILPLAGLKEQLDATILDLFPGSGGKSSGAVHSIDQAPAVGE